MAMASIAPSGGFRPSMLIYDTRYRSITIQVVFLCLFVAGVWWLVENTLENFRALGKVFTYDFLWKRSGYDINQTLIQYTNDSTHGRAMFVGLLNTLLVSAMSCVLATIIGVIAGVLRLSGNWVVGRLMTVYVEAFRNTPLLMWIILINTIMFVTMPEPRDFRGDTPLASMNLFGSVALTNRGIYVPEPLFTRSLGNIDLHYFLVSIDLLAVIAALALSYVLARRIASRATEVQNATGKRPETRWKTLAAWFLPLPILLVALGLHLGYPALKGFNFQGGIQLRNSLIALWLALSIYTGAFIAETVRSGIMAVSRGQSEAAAALGLKPSLTTRLVVLPQALRVIVPPMISEYLSVTKNSSLALAVGYMDLRSTLGGITLNQTGNELEAMMLMMLIYLAISLSISAAMNLYNRSIKLQER